MLPHEIQSDYTHPTHTAFVLRILSSVSLLLNIQRFFSFAFAYFPMKCFSNVSITID